MGNRKPGLLSGGVGEGSRGAGEYLSWNLKDPQVREVSTWKEHSRQREQCELSQEGSEEVCLLLGGGAALG